jgi:hypothetical protein
MAVRYVPDPNGYRRVKEAVGYGLLNYLYRLEGAAKANAPVRGGHRSFAPGGPIGGTLRRSIHAVVYVDGKRLAGSRTTDENGQPVGDYPVDGEIVGVVGTNVAYGVHVHNGTVKMAARPFITEALAETRSEAPGLIEAGMRAKL